MWKVKRMNTARIVVLAIALGAGGVAAYLASRSDTRPAPAEPAAKLPAVGVLLARFEIGLSRTVRPEDPRRERDTDRNGVDIVRPGVPGPTTMQK